MIDIINLKKAFGANEVLRGVNLKIPSGECFAIIGRSGCGKSVLLKHIIGLLIPDEGEVKIEGRSITEADKNELYEIRRQFGFLFQGAALFDSMTVFENVSLPLIWNDYTPSEGDTIICKGKVTEKTDLNKKQYYEIEIESLVQKNEVPCQIC